MSVPEHVTLAREAQAAGLIVTHLMPAIISGRFGVQLWQPDGTLRLEGPNQSAAMIRAALTRYQEHQRAEAEDRAEMLGR